MDISNSNNTTLIYRSQTSDDALRSILVYTRRCNVKYYIEHELSAFEEFICSYLSNIPDNCIPIKDLGYNGIWLMPIFQSSSYHKYNADNYYQIDTNYGTKDDLIELINEAHKRDINIILDLAINHASFNNPLYIDSREAYNKYLQYGENSLTEEEKNYKDLFSFKTDSTSIKGRTFTSAGKYNFYVEENFSGGGMPEFNFESTFTIEVVKKIMKYYLELGVDGFRYDAFKHLNKSFRKELEKYSINSFGEVINVSKEQLEQYKGACKLATNSQINREDKNYVIWVQSHDDILNGWVKSLPDDLFIKEYRFLAKNYKADLLYYCKPFETLWKSKEIREINFKYGEM